MDSSINNYLYILKEKYTFVTLLTKKAIFNKDILCNWLNGIPNIKYSFLGIILCSQPFMKRTVLLLHIIYATDNCT